MPVLWRRPNGGRIFGGAARARSTDDLSVKLILNQLPKVQDGSTILEVGCGYATHLKRFEHQHFVTIGLDPKKSYLNKGKEKGNARNFCLSVGEKMPFRNATVDVVLLLDVLEHVADPDMVLGEVNRVLKPNGTVLLSAPNKLFLFETHGIQIGDAHIHNFLGVGIPFFSLPPDRLRRRFERARIYTESKVVSLFRKHDFQHTQVSYMMPPLDRASQNGFIDATRKVLLELNKVPLIRNLGVTIIATFCKVGEAPTRFPCQTCAERDGCQVTCDLVREWMKN